MPTEIQLEAARLIEVERRSEAAVDKIMKAGTILGSFVAPFGGVIVGAIFWGAKKLAYLGGDPYVEELQKVVDGTRDTLPERPEGSNAGAG